MHFPNQKLIFIHIQKTAGNWIQKNLVQYSDDNLKKTMEHHDLQQRFDVAGKRTQYGKHQTLHQAASQIDPLDAEDYHYFAVIRHPVSRLVSFYFSPHLWLERDGDSFYEREKYFDFDTFVELVNRSVSMREMLSVKKKGLMVLPKNLTLIRYENFEADMRELAKRYGFLLDEAQFNRRVNDNSAAKELISQVTSHPPVINAIVDSRHGADFSLFNYSP
jgi:hypothetical protein